MQGGVLAASWLSSRVLLAVSFVPAGFEPKRAWIGAEGDGSMDVKSLLLPLRRDGVEEAWENHLLVAVGSASAGRAALDLLVLEGEDETIALEFVDATSGRTLKEVAQVVLPLGGTAAWHVVMDFLLDATADEKERRELGEGLYRMRELVREPLPASEVDRNRPRAVHGDFIWRIDESAFYVKGWAHSELELERLTAVSPEGERVELAPNAFRYSRPDVATFYGMTSCIDRLGFIAYVETARPSLNPTGWILELEDSAGVVQFEMPPVSVDRKEMRTSILADLKLEPLPRDDLKMNHIRPALARLQQRVVAEVAIDSVEEYGQGPEHPTVSIIIPLYARIEFLEHQLAQFVQDEELAATADLIYVLDSPDDAGYLRLLAPQLFRLYRVPYRLAVLNRNGGFSTVNNLGASLARADRLLLMNSDVIPASPGWLGQLLDFYDSREQAGAVSPKLLYEDDSIQHAGLYFYRPPGAHVWSNEHYFKGMHRDIAAASVSRIVPAVTGACLLTGTELYRELGGLRGMYVQGDYEDSDLCLRLAEAGYESWYCAEVALYHLEGQSYASDERELVSEYNKWLHTQLWREALIVQSRSNDY
jgi:GT2 family glycosyltransferase